MDINKKDEGLFIRDGQLPEELLKAQKEADAKALEEAGEPEEELELSPEATERLKALIAELDEIEEKMDAQFAEKKEEKDEVEERILEIYRKTPRPDIMKRLYPGMIDTAILFAIGAPVYYLLVPNAAAFTISGCILLYLFCVYLNLAEFILWIPLYLTNGYTVGKRLFKQRVIRLDGKEKLTLKDVLIRSFLIKGVGTFASYGMLNVASIIAAYIRPHSRAAHDRAAKTITVQTAANRDYYEDEPEKEEELVQFR